MDDAATRAERVHNIRNLEAQITELAGHLNAGTYRLLALIAEFDGLRGWSDGATYSCAHWLNWKCGIALGAARERVRVAHALEELPLIAAAMAKGEVSYSKVRAITRVASPATEDYFLNIALYGTAHHVETLVRCYRRAKEAEELSREARQYATRDYHDDDGSLVVKARLPAEVGELFLQAIDAAEREVLPTGVSAETSSSPQPTFAARRVDALAVIAESFVIHGVEALGGGERHQIVVHVDAETLRTSTAGRCELADGPSLAAESARRLACDSSVIAIVHEGRVAIHVLDDGAIRFVKPDGEAFDGLVGLRRRQPADRTQLVAAHRASGLNIDRHTATSRWRGETMDYGLAIDSLFGRES